MSHNVAEDVNLPDLDAQEQRFLTDDQVWELASECGPEYRVMVLFLAYTGIRWEEMAALRVGRMDFMARRALIAESATPVKGVMPFGTTKGHAERKVPIPPSIILLLAEHDGGKVR